MSLRCFCCSSLGAFLEMMCFEHKANAIRLVNFFVVLLLYARVGLAHIRALITHANQTKSIRYSLSSLFREHIADVSVVAVQICWREQECQEKNSKRNGATYTSAKWIEKTKTSPEKNNKNNKAKFTSPKNIYLFFFKKDEYSLPTLCAWFYIQSS